LGLLAAKDVKFNTYDMKTAKVIYRTDKGKVFKTIAPIENTESYMNRHYSEIEILSIRPSVKVKYAHVVNKSVKS
jgi:hypothetical protein